MHDAIVIGGGPAGSLCSLLLARSGWRVTVVEQHSFPRDKVCGECLGAMGVDVLARGKLLEPLLLNGAGWLCRANIFAPDGSHLPVLLPRPMLGVSRWTLDAHLLEAARQAGALLLQPARCEAVTPGTEPAIRIRDLTTNVVRDLRASFVILADGKSALFGKAFRATCHLGIKSHWTGIAEPRDAIQLFGMNGGYGGFSPIEGGLWNAAFSISTDCLRRSKGDIERVFQAMMELHPQLRRKMAGARRVTEWMASPLPRFGVRRNWPAGVIPIGNAAAAIEPIGGEGMGLALRSAEMAAQCLVQAADRADFRSAPLRRRFVRLWGARGMLCRAAACVTQSGWPAQATFETLQSSESLMSAVLRRLGK